MAWRSIVSCLLRAGSVTELERDQRNRGSGDQRAVLQTSSLGESLQEAVRGANGLFVSCTLLEL